MTIKNIPEFVYISEEEAQGEFQHYLKTCVTMQNHGAYIECMDLPFASWLEHMGYRIL